MADPQTTASSTSTDDNELSGLLNQSFNNPLMKDYVGSKAKAAMLQQGADVKKAEILEQTQKPFIEQELAKRKELEPQQADIRAQMSKPFQVPQPMMADFASLGGMLAVTASMLGGAGKQPAMQAMAAMTGVLDGYQKGRKDLVDRSFKEFDANMKRLQGLQKAIDDELANYVAQMKAGKEGAALSAQTLIARTSGGSYAAAIMNQSADKTLEIGMQAQRLAAQRQDALLRIDAERDREDRKNVVVNPQTGDRGYVSSKDGKFHKLDVPQGFVSDLGGAERPFMVDKDNNPVYPDSTGRYPTDKPLYKPGSLKTSKNGEPSEGGSYQAMLQNLYPPGMKAPGKEPEAQKIFDKIVAIKGLEKFYQKSDDPAIRFGEIGNAQTRLESIYERNFKQFFGGENPNRELTDAEVNKFVAQTMRDFQTQNKLTDADKNVVFAKEYVFNAIEAERAAKGGQVPVYMIKNVTPLLSPKNMTKEAFQQIWGDRIAALSTSVPLPKEALATALNRLPNYSGPSEQKPVYLNNREIVVVNGRWVYKDTQQPVEQ